MTEIRIDEAFCKGCNLCVEMCPKGVFEETEELGSKGFKLKSVVSPEKCTSCKLCEFYCPGAISLDGVSIHGISGKTSSKKIKKKSRGGWREKNSFLVPGKHFLSGNEAIVEGACDAGCQFFAGYPITPANEILTEIIKRLEKIGGVATQAEDEIAVIAMVQGASWAGAKAMAATSGPGFTLMQEILGWADDTETSCVVVDVQRAGPSTGQPTRPAAMDMREVRWGAHGGIQRIVLYPESVQECYDLTIKAFNLSEKFRTPVILLSDAYLAHLYESVEIQERVKVFDRIYKPGKAPFGPTRNFSAPSMPRFGDGENISVTGSTHNQWGERSTTDPKIQEELVLHLQNKILKHRKEVTDVEEMFLEDAEIILVVFGTVGRSAKWAVKKAREQGIRVGLLRPRIVYPFPTKIIKKFSSQVKYFAVPEMNQGQMFYVVREKTAKKVISLSQPNGQIIDPRRILKYLLEGVW